MLRWSPFSPSDPTPLFTFDHNLTHRVNTVCPFHGATKFGFFFGSSCPPLSLQAGYSRSETTCFFVVPPSLSEISLTRRTLPTTPVFFYLDSFWALRSLFFSSHSSAALYRAIWCPPRSFFPPRISLRFVKATLGQVRTTRF